ncbi:MAG: hypothetical protein ACXABG_01165 [Promethearchaeota archaeon]|jgi:hypothetical protein
MRKRSIIPLSIVLILLLGTVGGVIAFPSMIETFTGAAHSGCHGFSTPSAGGSITLGSSAGTTLTTGQEFNLTAQITGFTEAITGDRGSECSLAVAPTRGDNGDFASPLSDPIRYSGVTLDGSGDSGVVGFILLAPSAPGSYMVVVDAVNGINHTDDSALPIIFASANLTITVGAEAADAAIPGFNLFIVISVGILAAVPIVLIVRKRKTRNH